MAGLLLAGGIAFVGTGSLAEARPHGSARHGDNHKDDMLKLAPEARLEQRCNARAMGTVDREHREMHPDELVAYAFSDTVVRDHTIRAPGAAVRSGGQWYHLSYTCTTTPDGLDVLSLSYSLGTVVPHAQWSEHYLVP